LKTQLERNTCTTLAIALLGGGICFLASSCGGAQDETTDDGSAITGASAGAFYDVVRDERLCPAPICGGYFVHESNKALTRCADGTLQQTCHVSEIDLQRPYPLPPIVLVGQNIALARGSIPSDPAHTPVDKLVASAVWRPATGAAASGSDYRLSPQAASTSGAVEHELNTGTVVDAAHVSLAIPGISPSDLQEAEALLAQGRLYANGRNFAAGGIIVGIIFDADQIYLPLLFP
jgi:hypothetical protein